MQMIAECELWYYFFIMGPNKKTLKSNLPEIALLLFITQISLRCGIICGLQWQYQANLVFTCVHFTTLYVQRLYESGTRNERNVYCRFSVHNKTKSLNVS